LKIAFDAMFQVLDSNNMILKTKKNMRILVGNQYEIDVPSAGAKAHMLSLHNGIKVATHAARLQHRVPSPVSLQQIPGDSGELLFYGHRTSGGALSGEAMPMDALEDVDHASPEHVELEPTSGSKATSVL
jgi:hypothetical protein